MEQTGPFLLSGSSLPPRLSDLPEPPRELYVHGELPRGPAVALVGTRRPTSEALGFCRALAAELARAGVAVFSGGAEGIDSAAHEGALAVGGSTVVVAPSSLDRPFPSDNAALFRRIVEAGGAHVSLWPEGTAATQPAFFARNACLVGLCHALVVIEAPFRSGARNAARWARTLGRPLFAVPSAPWNERGRGCLLELRAGAKLCEGASDILDALSLQLLSPVPLPSPVPDDAGPEQVELPLIDPNLSADERVLAAVRSGASHVDDVSTLSGLSLARTQESILTLTVKGVLAPDAGGRIVEGALSKRTQSRRRSRK